jgi:ABC-type glycerol-3-phosphate transport system permease component
MRSTPTSSLLTHTRNGRARPIASRPAQWNVAPNPQLQPLSVRLPSIQSTTELDVFLAALAISTLIPVVLFLGFQRMFLNSAGLGGAVKG